MSSVIDIQNRNGDQQPKRPGFWSRLCGALLPADRGAGHQAARRGPVAVMTAPSIVPAAAGGSTARPQGEIAPAGPGVILPFPVHGEALLVKLADVLRDRFADRSPQRDPLLLQMSRCPGSRLSIDRTAYVEFHQDGCGYRAVIEASAETRVILETTDFDSLVDFVLPYVVGRLAKPAMLEPVS
jgi:hypothetical protein